MQYTRRRWLLPIAFLLLAALTSAVLWWRSLSPPPDDALEPGWAATALVIAGNGEIGTRDGDASRAQFSDPFGVAVGSDGTVYVADAGAAPRIRAISPDGLVSTLAGGDAGFADGFGNAARFSTLSGLALDAHGTLYVADTGNNRIRRVTRDGQVATLAGDGVAGYRDGAASQARFNGPIGVAVDAGGRVIVADTYNDRIRAIRPDGTVITLAGSADSGAADGVESMARFDTPCGVAVDAAGTIYVADTGNGLVREISPLGIVTTPGPPLDGLFRPIGIAAGPDRALYVTDDRGRVIEISSSGGARTVAGSTPGFKDGVDAQFRRPSGLAVAAPGRLIVADAGNALVRLVAARSRLEFRPPAPPGIAPRFDVERFAFQPLLWPIAPMTGPFEIAGTIGEARGGDAERFHAGIDVRADEGTPVRAVRDDLVAGPLAAADFGSLSESLRVGPISYVHLRVGRDRRNQVLDPARFVPTYDAAGTLVRMRVKRGARFSTGEIVGTINAFNHVHLNVGWPGEEYNPLRFRLAQFEDTVPPTIAPGGVHIYDENAQPLTRRVKGRLVVHGRVQVVVDAWDQVNGNGPQRRLGVYALGYQVLKRDGSPAAGFDTARETIRFDRLTPDPDVARLVYAPGSGIPFYGRRATRFLYIVTSTFRDGVASAGAWDTTLLAPGDYTLRVKAADIRGNEAVRNRDVPLTIVTSADVPRSK